LRATSARIAACFIPPCAMFSIRQIRSSHPPFEPILQTFRCLLISCRHRRPRLPRKPLSWRSTIPEPPPPPPPYVKIHAYPHYPQKAVAIASLGLLLYEPAAAPHITPANWASCLPLPCRVSRMSVRLQAFTARARGRVELQKLKQWCEKLDKEKASRPRARSCRQPRRAVNGCGPLGSPAGAKPSLVAVVRPL
jgi:hypothetical protein